MGFYTVCTVCVRSRCGTTKRGAEKNLFSAPPRDFVRALNSTLTIVGDGNLTQRRRDAGENRNCMAHTETQSHRENRKRFSLWLSVPFVASV